MGPASPAVLTGFDAVTLLRHLSGGSFTIPTQLNSISISDFGITINTGASGAITLPGYAPDFNAIVCPAGVDATFHTSLFGVAGTVQITASAVKHQTSGQKKVKLDSFGLAVSLPHLTSLSSAILAPIAQALVFAIPLQSAKDWITSEFTSSVSVSSFALAFTKPSGASMTFVMTIGLNGGGGSTTLELRSDGATLGDHELTSDGLKEMIMSTFTDCTEVITLLSNFISLPSFITATACSVGGAAGAVVGGASAVVGGGVSAVTTILPSIPSFGRRKRL